ncbi:S9 family peptidase [Aureibaculum conchae]|uniref:S9 family peptidase n=1 Tax=Aureibaculum sp. 2308TA14-22 TaxID=3108392 RepID=UPI003396FF59
MIKSTIKVLLFLVICSSLFLSCTTEVASNDKEQLTKQDYANAAKHLGDTMDKFVTNTIASNNWLDENTFIYSKTTDQGKKFYIVDALKKEKKIAFDHEKLASSLSKLMNEEVKTYKLPFSSFEFKNNNKAISFKVKNEHYQCNLEDYSCQKTENKKAISKDEILSPDGNLAAYIDNFNLWVRNINTGKQTQLTFDGVEDYGYATDNAGWKKSNRPVLTWSPNSAKLATFRQDARDVGEMYLTSTNVGHPKLEAWKHPLPGDEKVFKLERVIINVANAPKLIKLQKEPDYQRSTITDHVAGRNGEFLDVQWNKDATKLAFVSSSRDHKIAHLQIADAQTGKISSILTEEVDTYFESGVRKINWHVLFDSNEVLWFSERDNWGHMYLYDIEGNLKNQITKGDWAVLQVLNIDEKNRELIFTAGGKEEGNPYHQYLYKIGFDGNNMVNLTSDKGHHSISASTDFDYFVDTYSTTTNPPISILKNRNGEKILDLETADILKLKESGWQQPIEFTTKARDNETDLYGIMYLPSHYDENKSYPILNYIYPGPQSGSVGNYSFRAARRDYQAVAELGFVVVSVDAMGTPARSKSFHDFYYGNMGDNGIPDNITTIKQLAERYKGMDLERVGIWGHSGGGFASTGALFRYPEFYDVAVSGAGNHDNRNYEADWGEKWHGLLVEGNIEGKADGTTNYDSQANQLFAKNLKGKLLITHGTMDDNVPPSNTLLVVEALIKANKDFDMILFPNKRHGYGDMTDYMTRRRWDYFVRHLKHAEPPKEFSFSE